MKKTSTRIESEQSLGERGVSRSRLPVAAHDEPGERLEEYRESASNERSEDDLRQAAARVAPPNR